VVKRPGQQKRGKKKRQTKKIIWLGVEGKNKTERQYFNFFNRHQEKYVIHFAKGNYTDPTQIVNSLKKDLEDGDLAFAVFDTDTDPDKEEIIKQAEKLAEKSGIRTAFYISNDAVLKKLREYLPDYEKNQDVCSDLISNTKVAILRAERLRKYHKEQGHENVMEQNPSTGVDQIVKLLVE
jgi:hypothetical protein